VRKPLALCLAIAAIIAGLILTPTAAERGQAEAGKKPDPFASLMYR
jgi:hypothetical protein